MRRNVRRSAVVLAMVALIFGACSDDKETNGGGDGDTGGLDSGSPDSGANVGGDAGEAADSGDRTDAGGDAGEDGRDDAGEASGCLQAEATAAFRVSLEDDVSIEYSARTNPAVEGEVRDLSLLFERYSPGPDTGTFELGTGADANFGTCAHCVFLRTDTAERAYFADRGTLVSDADPYSRRPDMTVTNLRLIEVTVDPLTRESTPVADGRCVEVADFTVEGTFAPSGWTCLEMRYGDGEFCDCECGAADPDCFQGGNCLPGDPNCGGAEPLPVSGCEEGESCVLDPSNMGMSCSASCDWAGRSACDAGTCVFDFGVGEGDLCIGDPDRVATDVSFGEACPTNGFQVLCNVVDGFALGYCGPNNVCRPVCDDEASCTVAGESCRRFSGTGEGLGYCGPEPTDG